MLGRVRVSPMCSLETLEMERQPPKITKHDSLSIYEATLLKLKQGSQSTPPNIPREDYEVTDAHCTMAVDAPEETTMPTDDDSLSKSGDDLESTCSSKQHEQRNMSILHFFSKCNRFPHEQRSTHKEPIVGHDHSSSSIVSPTLAVDN